MEKNSKKKTDDKHARVQELNLLAQPDITKGVYSNVAVIHHTPNEFAIDFLFQIAGQAQMVSRVILSPKHMRALERAIAENLAKYDAKFETTYNEHKTI